MTETNPSSVLAFEDRFPVSEKKLERLFSNDQISQMNQSAANVLSAIISLEQISYEHVESDTKGMSTDLQRVEQKLDFITELLVSVLRTQHKLPENKTIKMSASHIVWCPEIFLKPGDYCLLFIYLSQKYPTPLELPVEVLNLGSEDSDETTIEARILFSDEDVIDDLTRMVFLYHRRQIARNKAQS